MGNMKWICSLVLIMNMFPIVAQQIRVVDLITKQPIVGANVVAKRFQAVTNNKGFADISTLKPPTELQITYTGYYDETLTTSALKTGDYVVEMVQEIVNLEPTLISVTKTASDFNRVANKVDVISSKEISALNPQTSADMLAKSGAVYVQKSQMGGGSPVIRGFEANKVLLVIDGVRMNNAIYRSGHLQNVITINPNTLERAEVVHGPGSLIYGSDALGGVMHFYTKSAPYSTDSFTISGGLNTRFGTANFERTAGAYLSLSGKKWSNYTAVNFSDFADQRIGANRPDEHGDWGLTPDFITQIDGLDTIVANADPNIQKFTGYTQIDILNKLKAQLTDNVEFTLNTQYSNSSNVPRYDKLREIRDGQLRFAEWYYGPQLRVLVSPQIEIKKANKLFTSAQFTAGYQHVLEERVDRQYRRTGRRERLETLHIASFNADFYKEINGRSSLNYGAEYYYNNLLSTARQVNIESGESVQADTRYPGEGSFAGAAIYINHRFEINEKLTTNHGLRLSGNQLNADFINNTTGIDLDGVDFTVSNLTGSADLIYRPTENLRTHIGYAGGFRAPNIDDVGKINDPSEGLVVIPSGETGPEKAHNFETGLSISAWQKKIKIGITGFYTLLVDAIERRPAQFNGQDSIEFNGLLSQVLTKQNVGSAFVAGGGITVNGNVNKYFGFTANVNYTYGQDTENDIPLSHIPPLYGKIGVTGKYKGLSANVNTLFNGAKRLERYAPLGSSDNLEEALPTGTPSWYTLNLDVAYRVSKTFTVQGGMENILDVHYRPFSSGLSAAGRNFFLSLSANF